MFFLLGIEASLQRQLIMHADGKEDDRGGRFEGLRQYMHGDTKEGHWDMREGLTID